MWDIVKLKGKDVSKWPYEERRKLLEETVDTIRLFNKNWQAVEKLRDNRPVTPYYNRVINDRRGLPFSEGIVIKAKSGIMEDSWYKMKDHDLIDMEILEFMPGKGGKYADSLGAIRAKDLQTGNVAIVGTGYSDFERDWIWNHKHMLSGAVIKTKVMEVTNKSARAPRFVEFHESKGNNEFGLLLYSDALAGLDNEREMLRVKHSLINK